MNKKLLLSIGTCLIAITLAAQIRPFDVDEQWLNKISELAPEAPTVAPGQKRKMLVFGLHTGFYHWTIPHTNEVMKILGEQSGAFEVELTSDVRKFAKEELEQYDAVVVNNSCSIGPRRDLILDALEKEEALSQQEQIRLAASLEASLISYVQKGGGLMVIHGGIVMQNNSMAFSEMVGGSFDYHPPQQELRVELVEPGHPLVSAFEGEAFTHVDEPYLFKNAYLKKDFRPLLYIDPSKITNKKKDIEDKRAFVSWIRAHGQGRVFYVSPSHNAQSLENPRLLKYYLDGAQYVLGDLQCDDSPVDISTDYK